MSVQSVRSETPALADPERFWAAVGNWLQTNTTKAVTSAICGAALSFATTFFLTNVVFGGAIYFDGSESFLGSMAKSTIFCGIGSTVFFGLFGYWRAVGNERFWRDIGNAPQAIAMLFREGGTAARIHLLWGAAVGLITAQVVSPWVGTAVAFGLLAAAPNLFGKVLVNMLLRCWLAVVQAVAPTQGRAYSLDASASMVVGMLGTAATLVAANLIPDIKVQIAAALACILLAFLMRTLGGPSGGAKLLLLLAPSAVLAQLAWDVVAPLTAEAQNIGFLCSVHPEQMQCPGRIVRQATTALAPGFAALFFAPFGRAIGELLGDSTFWPGGGSTEPPRVPPILDPFNGNKPLATWKPGMAAGRDGRRGEPGDVMFGGNWVSPETAREMIQASLDADKRRADASASFARESEEKSTQWLRQKAEEAARLDAEAARQRADAQRAKETDGKRRQDLAEGIKNAIRGMDPGEQRSALIRELGDLMLKGDTAAVQELWSGLRGQRQGQLDQWRATAESEAFNAKVSNVIAVTAEYTRDISKIVLVTATGNLAATAGLATAAAAGVSSLGTIGALEGGLRKGDDGWGFDGAEGIKGFGRGAKTAITAAIGGVPTGGSSLTALLKVTSQASLDTVEAYAETGDLSKALASGAISLAGNAAGEAFDAGIASEFKRRAANHAANILAGTAQGVNQGHDVTDAFGNALKGEAQGLAANAFVKRAKEFRPDGQGGGVDDATRGLSSRGSESSADSRIDEAKGHGPRTFDEARVAADDAQTELRRAQDAAKDAAEDAQRKVYEYGKNDPEVIQAQKQAQAARLQAEQAEERFDRARNAWLDTDPIRAEKRASQHQMRADEYLETAVKDHDAAKAAADAAKQGSELDPADAAKVTGLAEANQRLQEAQDRLAREQKAAAEADVAMGAAEDRARDLRAIEKRSSRRTIENLREFFEITNTNRIGAERIVMDRTALESAYFEADRLYQDQNRRDRGASSNDRDVYRITVNDPETKRSFDMMVDGKAVVSSKDPVTGHMRKTYTAKDGTVHDVTSGREGWDMAPEVTESLQGFQYVRRYDRFGNKIDDPIHETVSLPKTWARLHETGHALTHANWTDQANVGLNEGVNEMFTQKFAEKRQLHLNETAYLWEQTVAGALYHQSGGDKTNALRNAFYNGDMHKLHVELGKNMRGISDEQAAASFGKAVMAGLKRRNTNDAVAYMLQISAGGKP